MISLTRYLLRDAAAKDEGSHAMMPCPTRAYHLGPRTAKEVLASTKDAEARAHALFSKMRRLLYPNEEEVAIASKMVRKTAPVPGLPLLDIEFALVGPRRAYILPAVKEIALLAAERITMSMDELLAGLAALDVAHEWLDDEHLAVSPISLEKFARLQVRAKEDEVRGRQRLLEQFEELGKRADRIADGPEPEKKWWQFWK